MPENSYSISLQLLVKDKRYSLTLYSKLPYYRYTNFFKMSAIVY